MAREAVGIDVGGTKILAARVAANGTIMAERQVATEQRSWPHLFRQIAGLARDLGAGPDTAVGLGLPGTVDQRRGTLIQAVHVPFDDSPVRDRLAAELGAHVEIDNDANCAALAEHRHGAARGTGFSVLLTLGTGIGGGVIADGRPYRGALGTGAELGHMVIVRGGRPCQGTCPGRGHLEAYVCGGAAGTLAREQGIAGSDALLSLAAAGDPVAHRVMEDMAGALGAGLVTLANAFNPEIFLIGGGFGAVASRYLLGPATAILRDESMRPNGEVPVVAAALGAEAGAVGAAELTR